MLIEFILLAGFHAASLQSPGTGNGCVNVDSLPANFSIFVELWDAIGKLLLETARQE